MSSNQKLGDINIPWNTDWLIGILIFNGLWWSLNNWVVFTSPILPDQPGVLISSKCSLFHLDSRCDRRRRPKHKPLRFMYKRLPSPLWSLCQWQKRHHLRSCDIFGRMHPIYLAYRMAKSKDIATAICVKFVEKWFFQTEKNTACFRVWINI